MPDFIFSRKADSDIDLLTDYGLENWGERQTRKYLSELYNCFEILSLKPELGRDASEYASFLQRYNHKAHTIFFEPIDKGIFIVRILGSRQEFENYL